MSIKATLLYDCGLIQLRYCQKNRKVFKTLYSPIGSDMSHSNLVVCMSDGRVRSGGLADRIHGIISLYIYCKERGYDFKVNFCEPFNLYEYFEPNKYDWKISPADLHYNLKAAKPLLIACSFRANNGTLEQELACQLRYLDKVIAKNKGKEFHIYTNMHYAHMAEIYSKNFHELFKPTKPLLEALNEQKKNIGSEYVGITLRFQNLLGDFQEGKFPTLDVTSQNDLIQEVKNKIMEVHGSRHPIEKFLVTSDSRRFLDAISDLDYVYTIPGKLVHMSYTPVHDFETHLKSFVDLLMLADAQKLYLLVTGQMYRSGFAESASFINCRPYEVIEW